MRRVELVVHVDVPVMPQALVVHIAVYFSKATEFPEKVELRIVKPPCFDDVPDVEYRDRQRSYLTEFKQEEQHR